MKTNRSIIIILFLVSFGYSNAQSTNTSSNEVSQSVHDANNDDEIVKVNSEMSEVYVMVDEQPFYKEKDLNIFNSYLLKELESLKIKKEDDCLGRAMFNFIVEKDGNISNFETSPFAKCKIAEKKLIEIITKTSGKWNPAKVKGTVVRSRYYINIKMK